MTRSRAAAFALCLALLLAPRGGAAAAGLAPAREPANLPAVAVRVAGDVQPPHVIGARDAAWLIWLAAARLDLPPPPKVELVIAARAPRDAAEARRLDLPPAPYWASGLAEPGRGRIIVFSDRIGIAGHEGLPGLILHEAAHLVLAASLPPGTRLPRWYEEGIALLVERDLSLRDAFELALMSFAGEPLPLSALSESWPATGARSRAAYAQALSFVAHARRAAVPGAPRRLVDALRGGAPFETAFVAAYGADVSTLERDWRIVTRRSYESIPLVALGLAANAVFGLFGAVAVVVARRRRRRVIESLPDDEPVPPQDGRE